VLTPSKPSLRSQAKKPLLLTAITAAASQVTKSAGAVKGTTAPGKSAAATSASAVSAAAAARRKRPEGKASGDKGRRLLNTRKWLMFDGHGQMTFMGALFVV